MRLKISSSFPFSSYPFFPPLNGDIDTCHKTAQGTLWPLKVIFVFCVFNRHPHLKLFSYKTNFDSFSRFFYP